MCFVQQQARGVYGGASLLGLISWICVTMELVTYALVMAASVNELWFNRQGMLSPSITAKTKAAHRFYAAKGRLFTLCVKDRSLIVSF